MKAVATPPSSLEAVFDAVVKAARRAGEQPVVSEGRARTWCVTVRDAGFARQMAGTHRVQRVPKGSAARHTSTCTIAVVDAPASDQVVLEERDLVERFCRGSGPGGQHRNKTDSCCVLRHVPSGVEVRVDMRSQWESRQQARAELTRRLQQTESEQARAKVNRCRADQVASDRAAKQFTHNEQRGTVVDHESGRTWQLRRWGQGRW